MSGYDYNVGYLPGSAGQNSPVKSLIKWVLIAFVVFVLVQLIRAASTASVKQSSLHTIGVDTEIDQISNVEMMTVSTTPVVTVIDDDRQDSVGDLPQNSLESVPVNEALVDDFSKDNLGSIQAQEVVTSDTIISKSSVDNIAPTVFDEELANLLNSILPK